MQVEKISEYGVYRLSRNDEEFGISTNTYLIVDQLADGKREIVLVDPGSVQGYPDLLQYLQQFMQADELKYVILQHQDPDLCACTPLLEKQFAHFQIATHWRSAVLVKHYGINHPFYYVDRNGYTLTLASGRQLVFFHTPYAHSPAAIMTYDCKSKILLSGDLFGAFAINIQQSIDGDYFDAVKIFHENYIPSRKIMNLMLNKVRAIQERLGIEIIAPQHGHLLSAHHIEKVIDMLTDLECGGYLIEIEKELISQEQGVRNLITEVYKMQQGVFGSERIDIALAKESLFFGEKQRLTEACYSLDCLDKMLNVTFELGGHVVLDSFKNRILRLCNTYGLPVPKIFNTEEYNKGVQEIATYVNLIGYLSDDLTSLQRTKSEIEQTLNQVKQEMYRDSLTGLFNRDYLEKLLQNFVGKAQQKLISELTVLAIGIDNLLEFNEKYGEKKGNSAIAKIATVIKEIIDDDEMLFKHYGAQYVLVLPEHNISQAKKIAEQIRNHIFNQEIIGEKFTVSIGITEFVQEVDVNNEFDLLSSALAKQKMARQNGGNQVYIEQVAKRKDAQKSILVVDNNQISRRIIRNHLQNVGYNVVEAENGSEAIQLLQNNNINLVITEILLPRKDGYAILQAIKTDSNLQNVPVIFVTALEYSEEMIQAVEQGAIDYITKPFSVELIRAKVDRLLQ